MAFRGREQSVGNGTVAYVNEYEHPKELGQATHAQRVNHDGCLHRLVPLELLRSSDRGSNVTYISIRDFCSLPERGESNPGLQSVLDDRLLLRSAPDPASCA